jgi:L-ascorbate metabolism protein UlaG (beta-lactamase superfamily)
VPSQVGGITMMFRILPLYLTKPRDANPRHPLGPFHTDPSVYSSPPETGLRITWFGHSSMLLELDGVRILIDPVWDPRASPRTWLGPKRFFAPTLPLEQMPPLDAILISHDHYDHLGADTVRALARLQPNTPWITSLGVAAELARFGIPTERITELDWTQTTHIGPVQVTSVPSRHFSGRSLSNRFETLWASFVLRGPAHNVFYSGDSGMWPGFQAIGAQFGPFDLSMIEIGAFHELWKDIHLGPDGAIAAFEALGNSGVLMPIHWGLFDLALHAWQQPIERIIELAARRKIRLFSPPPGTPTDFQKGQPFVSDWWRRY